MEVWNLEFRYESLHISKRLFMQLIWLLCFWVVWNERNNRLFNNIVTIVPRLIDKVKLLPLARLKAKKAMFVFGT